MQDLNATMFYKAKFNIRSINDEPEDLLWKLVMNIRSWITSKLNRYSDETIIDPSIRSWTSFKLGSKFYDNTHQNRVYCESSYHEAIPNDLTTISWACKIVEKPEPENGFAPREWITEIGYRAISATSAEISYVVTYSDLAGFIGLCMDAPSLSVPNVIKSLINDDTLICSIGANQLSLYPIKLHPGDYPAFKNALLNEERELPIIYISPKRVDVESNDAQLLIDPKELSICIAANALVYYADSLDFSREMNYLCNNNYLCSAGAIRIYQPHINTDDPSDSRRHRFLSAHFIENQGSDQIIEIFRRALAQDVHYYESLFRIKDCQLLIEADQRRKRIARIKAKSEDEIDEATNEYLAESSRREEAEQTVRLLKDENDQLKNENYNFQVQVSMLRERAEKYSELEKSIQNVRNIPEYPDTPQSIAHYFETVYSERIAFTDRAYRSMEECETKNDLLWEVFYHIAVDLYDLIKTNPATAYNDFKDKTGWDCSRGEGSQTHDDPKLMREYVDYFNGQEINIEPHIKNGSKESNPKFVRIHFAYDPNIADKIIVGHCGKHLENYSSRKARK